MAQHRTGTSSGGNGVDDQLRRRLAGLTSAFDGSPKGTVLGHRGLEVRIFLIVITFRFVKLILI
ncbi:unnamed protein product [Protopolystoma xenopodis]|uniref:Uncharacterized protein n=1 Tax=Protopolystoma xenopodis TaxID=117903 RepID=A0A3S5CC99_9PLAT|nr:unnamed protein product [Protopolystoma xenopodis]